MFYIPVVDKDQKPLMPTTLLRAKRWVKSGKATYFYKKGILCARLNQDPSNNKKQQICAGVDPGIKREGITIKSKAHTYCNPLLETVNWVKSSIEDRKSMRQGRRQRKTPCRKPRHNRNRWPNKLSPSTKARWQFKLNTLKILGKMFPISDYCVENIKAESKKGKKKWNESFSPLEVGKKWFYEELSKLGNLHKKEGYETKKLRDKLGIKKYKSKLADKFECHNIDSWVLANSIVGGHLKPENKSIFKVIPLQFHRRQLHVFQSSKGGKRKLYGGTRSLGFKRGSIVRHKKYGICYIGGSSGNRASLHNIKTGIRLCQNAKKEDIKFLCYNSFRIECTV